jgi:predicted membrane chloride channel (bestrophin family)
VYVAGIEEIGVEIEEPFGILPLEVISNKSKADMFEIVNRKNVVKDIALVQDRSSQVEVNSKLFKLEDARDLAEMW